MTIECVQFSDSTDSFVISVFGCPQDSKAYPNQGQIDSNDPRYQAFINPTSTVGGQVAANEFAIQEAMDAIAQSRGYNSVASACLYASPTPIVAPEGATTSQLEIASCQEKFRIEGNALMSWVSLVWATSYVYMNGVVQGDNPMPTPTQAVALMPVFTWPD